jgi:RNA polymerase sigma factor (sigma-70 family)
VLTKPLKALAARTRPTRPPRDQVEPAALELIARYGADIMSTARRYSQTREDAEDAYQRGLEILLTKAPSTSSADLVPWLKTVVKHEAFSLRRQRERNGQSTAPDQLETREAATPPQEQLERLERLQVGAEAMQRLKPQEIRCMLLLAEGHTYKQICELTGFSYTKVNRCLAEGRRSFLRRVERIESGAECERLAPLLSALADGEASAKDMAVLRPHLRTCLSCRATLRDAREVPARVAALAPIGLIAGAHARAPDAWTTIRSAADWLHERITSFALRGQEMIEAASSHKLAAAAASAAALGGGGIATVEVGGGLQHGGRGGHPHRTPHGLMSRAPVAAPRWRPAAVAEPRRSARAVRAGARRYARAPGRHHPVLQRAPTVPRSAEPPAPAVVEPAVRGPSGGASASPGRSGSGSPSDPPTGEFGP